MRYVIWQVEKAPTTDKKHVQGYVEFPKPKKIAGIKTLFNDNTMHIEENGYQGTGKGLLYEEGHPARGPI